MAIEIDPLFKKAWIKKALVLRDAECIEEAEEALFRVEAINDDLVSLPSQI